MAQTGISREIFSAQKPVCFDHANRLNPLNHGSVLGPKEVFSVRLARLIPPPASPSEIAYLQADLGIGTFDR